MIQTFDPLPINSDFVLGRVIICKLKWLDVSLLPIFGDSQSSAYEELLFESEVPVLFTLSLKPILPLLNNVALLLLKDCCLHILSLLMKLGDETSYFLFCGVLLSAVELFQASFGYQFSESNEIVLVISSLNEASLLRLSGSSFSNKIVLVSSRVPLFGFSKLILRLF